MNRRDCPPVQCVRVPRSVLVVTLLVLSVAGCAGSIPPSSVTFTQSANEVQAYDYVEIAAMVGFPRPANPFTDAQLSGWFETADRQTRWAVDGFADSADGQVFRIRFAPPHAGDYRYFVEYRQGLVRRRTEGRFRATDGGRRGPVRVDSQHPWHFVWEGTGEHYYFNGTTAYWLFGWRDDSVITASLERLHRLKVNRVRVTLAGRTNLMYGEPVMVGRDWTVFITPWPAQRADDIFHPGFDYLRFDVAYWQKVERALLEARKRDMVVSLVLDMNDGRVHPVADSDDERRFIRYAVARFGAFSNITWDLGDDLNGYRDDAWTERTGALIAAWDPQHHLTTSHPNKDANEHQARSSSWFGFTSFQDWSRNQHAFMLGQRRRQRSTGRIIPQTNEEYGYEDHYPRWSLPPDAESADVLRRTAWEIAMAGGYQTTGESARRGTNVWPDAGGGWMNGRGDSTMTMLTGYGHMIDFFTSLAWWTLEPHDELVSPGAFCLSDLASTYVIYLPHGTRATARLMPGRYAARWFDAATGAWHPLPPAEGPAWTSPPVPNPRSDWALLLTRMP